MIVEIFDIEHLECLGIMKTNIEYQLVSLGYYC